MKPELERLLDKTIPDWRNMPPDTLIRMIFDRIRKGENVDERRVKKPPDHTGSEE